MIINVYTDRQGTEYKLIKANRVNWIVERLSDGNRMKGNAAIFTLQGTRQVEEDVIDPLIRIGAIVDLKPNCPLVVNGRAQAGDTYVIIGFGDALNEYKIITVGGNPRNSYIKSMHARYLTRGE